MYVKILCCLSLHILWHNRAYYVNAGASLLRLPTVIDSKNNPDLIAKNTSSISDPKTSSSEAIPKFKWNNGIYQAKQEDEHAIDKVIDLINHLLNE